MSAATSSPNRRPTGTGPSPFVWYADKQFDDCFLDEADIGPPGWANGSRYPNRRFRLVPGSQGRWPRLTLSATGRAPRSPQRNRASTITTTPRPSCWSAMRSAGPWRTSWKKLLDQPTSRSTCRSSIPTIGWRLMPIIVRAVWICLRRCVMEGHRRDGRRTYQRGIRQWVAAPPLFSACTPLTCHFHSPTLSPAGRIRFCTRSRGSVRGQVHVSGVVFLLKYSCLAEECSSPRPARKRLPVLLSPRSNPFLP